MKIASIIVYLISKILKMKKLLLLVAILILNFNNTIVTAQILPGDLIITEFMANPAAVTDANGEWIEIYNTSNSSVDMNGFYISDGGADTIQIVSATPLIIPSGGYFVFGRSSDINMNGGVSVNYVLASFSVNNVSSSLILTDSLFNVIDETSYITTVNGKSTSLDPFYYDAIGNDNPLNWCDGTTAYGLGDFGTPGALNPACGVVGIGEIANSGPSAFYNKAQNQLIVNYTSELAVTVLDATGKIIIEKYKLDGNHSAIDVSYLEYGLYIYQLSSGKINSTGKFIK
jgi:Lamin Tail Domain/Secretion system C-terminal sorting domain